MRKVNILIVFLVFSILTFPFPGKVIKVYDGDTLTAINLNTKEKIKVRFYGIDAPELKQEYGKNSRDYVAERVLGQVVRIEATDTDRYGRVIAKIHYNDGEYLNKDLVRAGGAWWYKHYAKNDKELKKAMEYAKRNKLGLWSNPNAINPSDYRRGKKSSAITPKNNSDIVYVTKSGKKYHKEGCIYLKSNGGSYSLEEAEKLGYKPCSKY